jgi:hypothetical protein
MLPPGVIDHEVAGDRKQPGLEFPACAVLGAALKYADPGVLEKILRHLLIAREIQEVAVEAVLVLLDELIQYTRIASLQGSRDLFALLHPILGSSHSSKF